VELSGDEDGGVHLTLLLVRQQPNSKQGQLIDCILFASQKIHSKPGGLIDCKANSKQGQLMDCKLFPS
jgi:hypothetical protein